MDAGPVEFIPTRLPSSFNCLKRLYVSWVCLGEFFDLSFALCLIRSSPYIEEIEIEVVNDVYFSLPYLACPFDLQF